MEQFMNPGAEYRIQPFWFWNGDMNNEEIERQIAEMDAKGVGGFFICPRQGLQIPYLSETWFEKVRFAIEAAKKRGMHVWLYDEYPYPSGIAGGEVTLLHPDAKHQTLVTTEIRVSGGSKVRQEYPWAKVIYAKAVPVTEDGVRKWEQMVDLKDAIGNLQADPVFQKTGLTTYNQKRFFTYRTIFQLDWEAPASAYEWDILVYQEKEIEDFKYYGTFVDPCHKEAMQTFINLTHERYARHIGSEFGDTVKGMFTDEIGLLGSMPWTPRLEAYFQERNGYSIEEHIAALSYSDYKDAARIRYDYFQALHELLTQSYHKQVYDWCDQHGLQYLAEVPSIRMTTQRFSHIPGGDSAHEKLGRSLEWILRRYACSFRDNPKMTSSIARQLGRQRNVDECFHSVGWSMNMQDAKWMIDRMAALGTNFYAFHAFFYTVDGLTQHDAPPSQFYQNPYWSHFRKLGDYTGRISYMMAQGVADIRIAMLDPTTSFWTHMGNPLHHFDYGGEDEAEKAKLEQLKEDWRSLAVNLLQTRRDYDHLDPELLAEAVIENGKLVIGDAAYAVLLLPPMANLEQKAWEAAKRFLAAGGTVISFGLVPSQRIEAGNTVPEEAVQAFGLPQAPDGYYWQGEEQQAPEHQDIFKGGQSAYFIPRKGASSPKEALHKLDLLLDEVLPRAVTLDCGTANRSFLLQSRYVSEQAYIIFASNQEGEAWDTQITADLSAIWPDANLNSSIEAEVLDLETGGSSPLRIEANGECIGFPMHFAAYGSRMIQLRRREQELAAPADEAVNNPSAMRLSIEAEGAWKQKALTPNTVRFENFQLSMGDDLDGQGEWVQAKTFIDQCADLAETCKLPVSFAQIFGTPKKMKLAYPIPCRYQARFYVERIPEQCELLMDQSAILGDWQLAVNHTLYAKSDFNKRIVCDNSNGVCDVRASLVEGWNELTVDVNIQEDWHGIVDALYLYGTFGVQFTGESGESVCPILTDLPAAASSLAADSYYPGYPYFAGTLSFTRELWLDALPATERFELAFNHWDVHDLIEVLINGNSLGVRPWSPYVWEGSAANLRQGANQLEVRVTGTLIGMLEGKYFDYQEHRVADIHGERSTSHAKHS
ncbi:glycosyl hydrolase [Paenibacillus alba]|uniref:Glycosyl hydrolase n=1 Tax=Paenibacillus alba TaxID=1197127 RepID=A0ABU6G6V2_9BACL|nr:glycosyl hydrolase [Paenibacillus alba]MEC0229910.1 glycosyl hydrolase [Paenibacillus alba]